MKTYDPYRSYSECTACGRSDATACMYVSNLIDCIYCEHCKNNIIEDEEKEYPGDEGNHKESDFETAPIN